MSVKYYNSQSVQATKLQGAMKRIVRLTGYTQHPTQKVYGTMATNSIEIYQGDARIIKVTCKDQDLNVVDLNGGHAKLYIAESSKATEYILRKSTTNINDGAITNPAQGEVSLYLTNEDTSALPVGQCFYLVHVFLGTGEKYTVLSGLLNVYFDVGNVPIPLPPTPTCINIVDLDSGVNSYAIVFDGSCLVIGASLVAPSGTSENLFVTNIVYTGGQAVVYFNTSIPEAGWKLSYLLVSST